MSLPVRGAWIEMDSTDIEQLTKRSLPVRGAWIEIWERLPVLVQAKRRSPCGERGLKLGIVNNATNSVGVAPRAGSVD